MALDYILAIVLVLLVVRINQGVQYGIIIDFIYM